MIRPSPAIVSEHAARRLPRPALLLVCLVYVLAGFVWREPWKSADMTALGYMLELARGTSPWLEPQIMGVTDPAGALLPYWLGAWAIQWSPAWINPALASRVPFAFLLAMALASTWYATYHLARRSEAQPVAFAFGGEAAPADYARAVADGALLAIMACLGLAQLSHETTPALAQLSFGALALFGMAALSRQSVLASVCLQLGLFGLALSGAPALALLMALAHLGLRCLEYVRGGAGAGAKADAPDWQATAIAALVCLATLALVLGMGLWQNRLRSLGATLDEVRSFARLMLWFTWPAWPLALWTVWRWRRHIPALHIGLPLSIVLLIVGSTAFAGGSDRSLLLTLPALAVLAAFALPTLKRSVSAFIDWFTLLFFTGCAALVWLYWIAMQTGSPPRMAASVAKLTPGFQPSFQWLAFVLALGASLVWLWLVKWRVGRHQKAIWTSLVLPASGAALCWLLLMTLWLPMLDYARSYAPLVRRISSVIGHPACVQVHGLTPAQNAAFRYHGKLDTRPVTRQATCGWLLVNAQNRASLEQSIDASQWTRHGIFRRPSDKDEDILVYKRNGG